MPQLDIQDTSSSHLDRIPVASPMLPENTWIYVKDCLDSTWISSSGKFIPRFEKMFAEFCGTKHAVACNNGTTALHLALACLGIGSGDEVIVPDLTYIASANCVTYCGATPVFVDCNLRTFNVDPDLIERRITSRTKAIMPVHLYGHACDMDPILDIARRHNLLVIEDAAEAHGATYKGKRVGSFGMCGVFSLFGNKIVTTGEGGVIVTDDDALADKLRLFRGQGVEPTRRYWHNVIGFNYRMTNIAAAIGVAQMERIDTALTNRKCLADMYNRELGSIEGLELPYVAPTTDHAFWMYTIQLPIDCIVSRDDVIAAMEKKRIETRPVFYPMHVLPPYAEGASCYPNAIMCSGRGINLPTHEMLTETDVKRIGSALREILSRGA